VNPGRRGFAGRKVSERAVPRVSGERKGNELTALCKGTRIHQTRPLGGRRKGAGIKILLELQAGSFPQRVRAEQKLLKKTFKKTARTSRTVGQKCDRMSPLLRGTRYKREVARITRK